jgi:hypothetical protein
MFIDQQKRKLQTELHDRTKEFNRDKQEDKLRRQFGTFDGMLHEPSPLPPPHLRRERQRRRGGSVYLRTTTESISKTRRHATETFVRSAVCR